MLAIALAEWHHIWQSTTSSSCIVVRFPLLPYIREIFLQQPAHPSWRTPVSSTLVSVSAVEPNGQTEQGKKSAALTVSCPRRLRRREENEKHGEASVSDVCWCSSRSCLNKERHSRLFHGGKTCFCLTSRRLWREFSERWWETRSFFFLLSWV